MDVGAVWLTENQAWRKPRNEPSVAMIAPAQRGSDGVGEGGTNHAEHDHVLEWVWVSQGRNSEVHHSASEARQ